MAFGGLSTNMTPVINGGKHFSATPRGFLIALACKRTHTRPTGRSAVLQGSSGSSRNPLVMHVAPSARSPDPFLSSEAEWSANSTDWDEVFQVSEYFNTPDIPLWTPLTNPSERRQVVRDNAGRCLNCHGIDHSFRNCAEPFINASGCINPQLGQLGDNGETYRRWQRRMLSYRRPNHVGGENTRSSPYSHRRKGPSRRYENNRRNKSGYSNSHLSHHCAPQQFQHGNTGGTRGGGPATNSLTIFQPQQGVPPAPSSGTHAPGMRYGSNPNTNPNGRQPGTFRSN